MDSLSLLAGGSEPELAAWEKIAAEVLRKSGRLSDDDADSLVWGKLTRTTLDGLAVTPLGTPAVHGDLQTAGRPARAGAWDIRPVFADADDTASQILTDLENGATSVWLQLGRYGIPVEALADALKGTLLDAAPVVLDAGAQTREAADAFFALLAGTTPAAGTNLGADPIGLAVRETGAPDLSTLPELARRAAAAGVRAIVVDATTLHDRGASDVQELGYALAVGVAYLRVLVDAGMGLAEAADQIEFRLAATDEQFPTIAKLRAARRAWARVLTLSSEGGDGVDGEPSEMRIHAVTSRPMMSRYDPWVNMLRTCVAAFAAGVGGADAVTVLPFDAPLGLPDAFARRIARNTSSLLIDEAHVAKVADPAGGSHLVEKLTDDTAIAAWAELGRLDEDGVVAALPALLDRVEETAQARDRLVATRKRPLTGLTEFPHLAETVPQRRDYPDGGIPVRGYGHAFEALRDDPAQAEIFLATMGPVAAHTARATFASNLFAAGGIGVRNTGAHADSDAVLADYDGERVVCLVGSDAAYAEWGTSLAAALKQAGARHVIVAGKPLDGTDDNCAMGLDALDFLTRTREQLR